MSDRFVYVTYIRTTPAALWSALTEPEFTRRYWFGFTLDSDWETGSAWTMRFADGRLNTAGEVLESDPPRRLVLSWRKECDDALLAEGTARATFEIEPVHESTRLTVTHEIDRDDSRLIRSVAGGWPMILASLKSMLETGEPLADPRTHVQTLEPACGG